MIIDGKTIAEDLYTQLKAQRAALPHMPRLGIVVTQKNPVIESFVRIKTKAAERLGVELVRFDIEDAPSAQVVSEIKRLAEEVDGVIVQLPLEKGIDVDQALSAIPASKDVDGINPDIPFEQKTVVAPVALAVAEILRRSDIDPSGKRSIVVGAGRLVGAPSAKLLTKLGANVSQVTLESGSLEDLKNADIIVSGTGVPGLIKPEHLKDGVVLIDAGTSETEGKLAGDADPTCAQKASIFTPVPGGIGPIAVAMIFKNLFDLMEKQ